MHDKKPAAVSAALTVIVLVAIAVLSILVQLLAFNGAGEKQGITAMGISLVCQGAGVIGLGWFARWLTNRLISKFKWSKLIAVITSVFLGITLGTGISILSIILSALLTGVR